MTDTELWSIKEVANAFKKHGIIQDQEPSGDLISRQAVIDAIKHAQFNFQIISTINFADYKKEVQEIVDNILSAQIKAINDLPSVNPQPCEDSNANQHNSNALNALEGDAISRQWLMECINEGWIKFDTEKDTNRFIHLIRDMAPPVTPQPKTDVLDKIRDEIDAHREKLKTMADDDWYAGKIRGYDCAIEIIDKYRESEVKE